jgi:hypothetical protein
MVPHTETIGTVGTIGTIRLIGPRSIADANHPRSRRVDGTLAS